MHNKADLFANEKWASCLDPVTGIEARASSVEPQSDGTVLQTFDGLGTMPTELCAYPVDWPDERGGMTGESLTGNAIFLK